MKKTDQQQYLRYEHKEQSLDLLDGDLATVLEYWRSLSSGGRVPAWDEFDLMELPLHIVPNINVFDAVDGGEDFKCRFWGSTHTEIWGREMAGKLLSGIHPSKSFFQTVLREMRTTITSKVPRTTTSYLFNKNDIILFQVLLRLPLTDASGEVVHCLNCVKFESDYEKSKKLLEALR